MGRLHLFEFEDLKWFPESIRNYGTDFLQFLSNKTKLFNPIAPIILKGLKKSGGHQIIDIASGGGGGYLSLNKELLQSDSELKILLSDFFPNKNAFEHTAKQASNIQFTATPVDARNVPKELKGLRTQFLSLHHFQPEDARKILQNAVDSKSCIAIFEAQERSFTSLLAMFFSPISVLISTPFIRPFKFGRILFTYIIPIVPFFVWWDGIVSSLRTYSESEMQDLINSLHKTDTFDWEIGRVKSGPGFILYLLGTTNEEKTESIS
jgi:hypothetical protein